jgi:Protein of unknown function (DUF3485)
MMKYLPAVTAVLAILSVGLVHGFWTDRWQVSEAVATAAARLNRIPRTVGDWQGKPLEGNQNGDPALAGQLYLRYVNRKTGDAVSVALVCGRAAVVCIHTPDVCYRASGFAMGKRNLYELKQAGKTARFFTSQAEKTNAADQTKLRIFWSWFAAGEWQAVDNPRLKFHGPRPLYKFYVIHELTTPLPLEQDPSLDFLRQFLPQAEKALGGV